MKRYSIQKESGNESESESESQSSFINKKRKYHSKTRKKMLPKSFTDLSIPSQPQFKKKEFRSLLWGTPIIKGLTQVDIYTSRFLLRGKPMDKFSLSNGFASAKKVFTLYKRLFYLCLSTPPSTKKNTPQLIEYLAPPPSQSS